MITIMACVSLIKKIYSIYLMRREVYYKLMESPGTHTRNKIRKQERRTEYRLKELLQNFQGLPDITRLLCARACYCTVKHKRMDHAAT